jgi:hypothetical protein
MLRARATREKERYTAVEARGWRMGGGQSLSDMKRGVRGVGGGVGRGISREWP